MSGTAVPVRLPADTRSILPEVRRQLPRAAQRITAELQATVPGFASGDRRHQLIYAAVNSAAAYFLDHAMGESVSPAAVEDLYQQMGYREAAAGADQTAVESAVRIAARACWDEIRVTAANRGVASPSLESLRKAFDQYVEHLVAKMHEGHDAGHAAREKDSGLARHRLSASLLTGADRAELEQQAEVAQWPLPSQVVVTAVDVPDDTELRPEALPQSVLYRTTSTGARAVVIADDEATDDVTAAIQAQAPQARIATCWPVPADDVAAAHRWAQRALDLADTGVIPARPVIDCAAHRTEIWLHAEPAMRRQLAQELLKPLFKETPNSREILSETLLVWLETRDSAPTIAARLGVHPQTVRYRWRRINELFGDALHDPARVLQLTLVLKASVPLWIAGDQSDFERFRTRRAAEAEDDDDA